MTKFEDDDERIAPLKSREKRKALMLDRLLTVTGLALAGAAAFFPWYVFFNEDKFSINVVEGDRSRELPNWPARNVSASRHLPWSTRMRPGRSPSSPSIR